MFRVHGQLQFNVPSALFSLYYITHGLPKQTQLDPSNRFAVGICHVIATHNDIIIRTARAVDLTTIRVVLAVSLRHGQLALFVILLEVVDIDSSNYPCICIAYRQLEMSITCNTLYSQ